MADEKYKEVATKVTNQAEIDKKNVEIEARRKEISVRRGVFIWRENLSFSGSCLGCKLA